MPILILIYVSLQMYGSNGSSKAGFSLQDVKRPHGPWLELRADEMTTFLYTLQVGYVSMLYATTSDQACDIDVKIN